MKFAIVCVALLALSASAGAQEKDKKAADSGWVDWTVARTNDVLTGFADLDEIGGEFAKKAGEFNGQSQAWRRLATDLSGGSNNFSPLRRAAAQAAANADKAAKLNETATSFTSNTFAGSWGSRLARFGTPIAALTGAVTAWWYGDNVGVAQDLANGLGSIKATGIGAALGAPAGPWGALAGGVIGNAVYTYGIKPRTVDRLGDAFVERTLPGPEPWDLARKQIFTWLDEALGLGSSSREALQGVSVGDAESQAAALESSLDGLYGRLDAVSAKRAEVCGGAADDAKAKEQRLRDLLASIDRNLEESVAYETETCSLLNKMAGADRAEVARIWSGYVRYAEGRSSSQPSAAQVALAEAEELLAELRLSEALADWAADLRSTYQSIQAEASSVQSQAAAALSGLAQAKAKADKAQQDREAAAALVGRAQTAVQRFMLKDDPDIQSDVEYVFKAVDNQFGLLPDEGPIATERRRVEDLHGRIEHVGQEAAQVSQTAVAALDSLADCMAGRPDVAALESELERARERARLTGESAGRAAECRAKAQTYAPKSSGGTGGGGWDLSGETETISSADSPAAPEPRPEADVSGLIRTVGASVGACDYGGALRAAQAIESAAPNHPWVQENQAAIAELRRMASLDLNQAIRRANVYLSTGNDASWAETLAPFLQAGCTSPALQQHLASAAARADGRGKGRDDLMASRVSTGHAQSNRNAASMRAATTALVGAASSMAAARRSGSGTGGTGTTTGGGGSTGSGGLPTAVAGRQPTPTPGASGSAQGGNQGCWALDRGAMGAARFVLVQYGADAGVRAYDLIPHRADQENFQPPNSRVIGRYKSYSQAKAALDRVCPPSERRKDGWSR